MHRPLSSAAGPSPALPTCCLSQIAARHAPSPVPCPPLPAARVALPAACSVSPRLQISQPLSRKQPTSIMVRITNDTSQMHSPQCANFPDRAWPFTRTITRWQTRRLLVERLLADASSGAGTRFWQIKRDAGGTWHRGVIVVLLLLIVC